MSPDWYTQAADNNNNNDSQRFTVIEAEQTSTASSSTDGRGRPPWRLADDQSFKVSISLKVSPINTASPKPFSDVAGLTHGSGMTGASHASTSSGKSSSAGSRTCAKEGTITLDIPARLWQVLDKGRYCIVRKLGYGQYSSVWLARDKGEDRFVSLKILTCEATKALSGTSPLSDELGLLQKIADGDQGHPGFRHNIKYYGSFEFPGPHGKHHCVITEVLGYSLEYVRTLNPNGDRRVQTSTVKRVVKHIVRGLEYLHDVRGIVHADIKHDNILFRPVDVAAVVAHELSADPSACYDCGTEISPPVVPTVSQVLPLSTELFIREDHLEAVVSDVGHSHWRDRHFQEIIQPAALRAPEVILGYRWDTPADIWNLGCIVMELLIGFWLFEPNKESGWGVEEDHLVRMTEALDTRFDVEFLSKCMHKDQFFTADGSFAHFDAHKEPTWTIRRLLEAFSLEQDEAEIVEAERFILRCLRLVPEERATAGDLANDTWLETNSMTGPTTVSCYITEILTDSTTCTHKAQYPRSPSAIIKEFIRVRLKVESIEELVFGLGTGIEQRPCIFFVGALGAFLAKALSTFLGSRMFRGIIAANGNINLDWGRRGLRWRFLALLGLDDRFANGNFPKSM
ncbi:predicted protein [Postia placenta Mad-698-R]|nr:predicted protein [Postia placenta Mad-698-R]